MKILAITPQVIPQSGWGRYSLSVIERLRLRKGVNVVVESDSQELANLTSPLAFIRNLLEIRRVARGVDIVHAFDGWPYGVYGYAGVFGTNKKLFITGIGTYSVAPLSLFMKGFLLRLAYKRARAIFCISNYTRKRIVEKTGFSNVVMVHMGNTPAATVLPDIVKAYGQKYGLMNRHPIVLTVGAIKHRKGQLDVLRAINRLKEKYPNIVYVMAGDTEDKTYVESIRLLARAENMDRNIRIIDGTKGEKDIIQALYALADVFILASNNDKDGHFEGFGLVLIEAAAAGKPVIGSQDCGIEDALEDGYNGYLIEQGNSMDIEDKLERILTADTLRFKKNALEFASRFSWDKTVDTYLEYYKR